MTFSAIVGENGSGKSTVVELMIRICNNFAASIFGEYSADQGQPHLHFIDGVYADLYYREDKNGQVVFYLLRIEGRNVMLSRYTQIGENKFISDVTPIYDNQEPTDPDLKIAIPFNRYQPAKDELALENVLSDFFYTYVSNFSTYAYNIKDFSKETTPVEYERKCRKTGSVTLKPEECHWLEGVFHRKMLYQEPLVLYPSRVNGNINVNTENKLAYLRFLSVLINNRSNFQIINDHIEVIGFQTSVDNSLQYNDKYIRKQADYRFTSNGYISLRREIIRIWGECIGVDLKAKGEERHHGRRALDYLVYKTLKTSSEYSKFKPYFHKDHNRSRSRFDFEKLKGFIFKLAKDSSHVTRKIRQTLIYLIYGLYDFEKNQAFFPLIHLRNRCEQITIEVQNMFEGNTRLRVLHLNGMEDLTPPPFFQSEVKLEDISSKAQIDFKTLSSGERQIIYSVTGILYQLLNIDSISPGGADKMICYSNINVILEEIELYFHPDMQRQLVKFLMNSTRQCEFHNLKAINFMLVTHSPFILSDIPARNVLALTKDGSPLGEKEVIKSFGANIHDILHHPFFLKDGAVGEFANDYIRKLGKDIANIGTEEAKKGIKIQTQLESLISIIDEPILKNILWEELNRRTNSDDAKRRWIDEQIHTLQQMKDSLGKKQQ